MGDLEQQAEDDFPLFQRAYNSIFLAILGGICIAAPEIFVKGMNLEAALEQQWLRGGGPVVGTTLVLVAMTVSFGIGSRRAWTMFLGVLCVLMCWVAVSGHSVIGITLAFLSLFGAILLYPEDD